MANGRINVFVTGRHAGLRDHLEGFGRAAGTRLKILATIGAMSASPSQLQATAKQESVDAKVIRLNVRLSDAFEEVSECLDSAHSMGGMLVRLAALGFEFTRSPSGLPHPSANDAIPGEAATFDQSNSDLDRIGLAAGLLSEDTLWR